MMRKRGPRSYAVRNTNKLSNSIRAQLWGTMGVGMNSMTGVAVLGLMAVLLLGSLPAWPQANPHDGPTITLGIGIKLPVGGTWPVAVGADHAIFYVPAVGKGEMLGVLVVPKGRSFPTNSLDRVVRPAHTVAVVFHDVGATLAAATCISP
jgi:hypothetical protein